MDISITYNLNEFLERFSNNTIVKNIEWDKKNKFDIQNVLHLSFGGYWTYNPTLKMITHQYSE